MFSLKSASMASFLSSSFSLFLLCQPSYNMNMSSDTSKLLFTEAFALCNSSNDDLFPALDTCLLALILGPASSPAPDCRSDPLSPCLSVCTSVCPPILFVCLSVGARRKWLRFWVQSEYESRCVHQYTDTVGFQHWHSRDCMNAEVLGGAGTTNCSSAHACFSVCAVQKQTDMWNKRNACNGEEEGQEPIRFRFLFFCTDKLKKDHLLWLIIPAYSCLIYSTLLCLSGYS